MSGERNDEAGRRDEARQPGAEPREAAGAPAAEDDELSALRRRVAELEEELGALRDKYLRALAEAENVRKRAEREIELARKYGMERFAEALLDVVDNLERALEAKGDADALREGVRLTLESWKRVMERFGMERIDAVGHPFDPHHHEALMQAPSEEHPEGVVIAQHVAGYKLGERLLRPARVVVSSGPPAAGTDAEQPAED